MRVGVPGVVIAALLAPAIAVAADVRTSTGAEDRIPNGAGTSTSTPELTLQALVFDALARNLQIRIDVVRMGEAQALYELAAAQAYPRFSVTAIFGGPTPETKTREVNRIGTVTPGSLEGDFDFGSLGVTFRGHADAIQPLWTFGKISAAKDAATEVMNAAKHKTNITRGEVLLNLHKAFWAYQLTRSYVESLEDGQQILETVLQKTTEMVEADSPQVTENDRLRLIHAVAVVKVRLAEARDGSVLALRALRLLSGRAQEDPLSVVKLAIDDIPERPAPIDTYLADARARRPELRALAALIAAQSHFLQFRKNQYWPDIFLGGLIDYSIRTNATDQTNPFIYDPYNFFDAAIGVGIRAELDVFIKRAQVQAAEAQLNTRMAESAAASQAIDLEVRKLHRDVDGAYERLALLERANRAARGWLNASVLGFDVGAADAGELIDAFIARATAEGELKKTQYDIHLGLADLARASGRIVEGEYEER